MRMLRGAVVFALVLCIMGAPAFAATITIGRATAEHAGTSAVVALSLAPGVGEQVAALQIDLTFDAGVLSADQVTSGTSADAAEKDVSSSEPEDGKLRIIVAGFNQNAMSAGIIAYIQFGTAADALPGSYAIACASLFIADPTGGSISGTAITGAVLVDGNITAPNVTGLAQADAESTITASNLVVGTVSQEYSATVASGYVIEQDPLANSSVPLGTAVDLVVSKGPQPIIVPNVVGMSQTNAQISITSAGLPIGTVSEQFDPIATAGTVISQNPEANDSVLPGTAVDLVVSKGRQPIIVPNVVAMSQTNAQAALTSAGLQIGAVSEQYDATIPAGAVISQTPEANDSVLPGTAVDLVVSKGPQPVAVPNVVGMPQADARTALTSAGLAVGTITLQSSATIPSGEVIEQDPQATGQVLPGTSVNLIVSKGPLPVTVPNVVGLSQANAHEAITALGLAVGTVAQQYDAAIPAGIVITQDPEANDSVPPGTAVTLVVSKGPQPVAVPNVVGLSQANAQATILAATLTLGEVSQEYSATIAAGVVMSQDPAANSSALPGTPVSITVSKGPQPVAVPNVAGMTQANAQTAIAGAGLNPGTVAQEYSGTIPVGIVISQNPPADTLVAPATSVSITVSKGPRPVAVPNVAGMTQTSAQTAIASAGLVLGSVTEQYDAAVPAGMVLEQEPAANTRVAQGTPIALTISKGPAPVAIPDVSGESELVARALIAAAGLVAGDSISEYSDAAPSGSVIRTNPEAGTLMPPGSTVDLVISSGPAPVEVPDVTGKTLESAEAAILAATFVVGNETAQHSTTVAAGVVISQTPAAGTFADPQSAVALVVSDGAMTPNVVGLQQSDATAAITAAGFVVGNVTTESSKTVAAGVVMSQSLTAGTLANPGTSVDIVVSKGRFGGCVGNAAAWSPCSFTQTLGDFSILALVCACLLLHPRRKGRNRDATPARP